MTPNKTEQIIIHFLAQSSSKISNKSSSYAKTAISIAKELQIPVINIKNEVTDSHPDPLSLFPFRQSKNHYNSHGYELIAKAIIKHLVSCLIITLQVLATDHTHHKVI